MQCLKNSRPLNKNFLILLYAAEIVGSERKLEFYNSIKRFKPLDNVRFAPSRGNLSVRILTSKMEGVFALQSQFHTCHKIEFDSRK